MAERNTGVGIARSAPIVVALALIYAAVAAPLAWQGAMPVAFVASSLLMAAALIPLSAIDLASFRLPDALTLPLVGAGLALAALDGADALVWHAASAAIGALSLAGVAWLYKRVRGRDGLGLGDAKLFAAAGAWAGMEGLASVLLVACAAALAAVLVWRVRGAPLDSGSAIPFGPFIAFGLWVVWLYGPLA